MSTLCQLCKTWGQWERIRVCEQTSLCWKFSVCFHFWPPSFPLLWGPGDGPRGTASNLTLPHTLGFGSAAESHGRRQPVGGEFICSRLLASGLSICTPKKPSPACSCSLPQPLPASLPSVTPHTPVGTRFIWELISENRHEEPEGIRRLKAKQG